MHDPRDDTRRRYNLAACQGLQPRHWRILDLKLQVYSNDEIAQLLAIKPGTVSSYNSQICAILDCATIEEACRFIKSIIETTDTAT